jgi:hypothetical protein
MKWFFFFSLGLAALGCHPSGTGSDAAGESVHAGATDTVVTGRKAVRLGGCYQMILKRDTATLELDLKDSTVTGTLQYRWFEKDRNEGTLRGILREDAIHADYSFQSEGGTTVREVVFRIGEDGSLQEGFGDLVPRQGKLVFADKQALQYQVSHPFLSIPCNNRSTIRAKQ